MAINVIDNFSYRGKKPNFDRDSFDTLSAMKSFPETDIDEGHISFCKEDGKHYQFSSANEVDPTTGKWREDKKLPDNIVLSKPSTGIPSIADVVLGNLLTKTEQALIPEEKAQVQENIGVKDTMDVVGAGDTQNISYTTVETNKFRNKLGNIESGTDYSYSPPIPVQRGDRIIGSIKATQNVMVFAIVDVNNNVIGDNIIGQATGNTEFDYAVKADGYMSLSGYNFETTSAVKLIPCKIIALLAEPAGGYHEDLYKAAGATQDEAKGEWLLNDLELSNAEMAEVYNKKTNSIVLTQAFYNTSVRTNIPILPHVGANVENGLLYCYMMCRSSKIEIFAFDRAKKGNYNFSIKELNTAFSKCPNLKEVWGILDVSRCTTLTGTFDESPLFEFIRMKGVKVDVSFKDSPNLLVEDTSDSTLGYLVENAANTEPITVTLHPDAFARVPQTLIEKATAKQISIASA